MISLMANEISVYDIIFLLSMLPLDPENGVALPWACGGLLVFLPEQKAVLKFSQKRWDQPG
jgi:hypothetical protein